jgi:hypothetical protein
MKILKLLKLVGLSEVRVDGIGTDEDAAAVAGVHW